MLTKEERRAAFESLPLKLRIKQQRENDKIALEKPGYNASIVERARERMDRVDKLPPDLREMVHEFGLEIVQEFINHNVRKPKAIRHLIETVRGQYADGRAKIRPNVRPEAKQNSLNIERDIPLPGRYR